MGEILDGNTWWEENNGRASSHVRNFHGEHINRFVLGSEIKFGSSTRRVATCSLKITHPATVPLPAVLLCLLYKHINSITIICAATQCVPKRLGSGRRPFIKIRNFDGYPVTICTFNVQYNSCHVQRPRTIRLTRCRDDTYCSRACAANNDAYNIIIFSS